MENKSNYLAILEYFRQEGLDVEFIEHVSLSPKDADVLEQHIRKNKPQNILEIGTFVGVSSTVLALAKLESTPLTCVDLNLPVAAHNLVGSGGFVVHDETRTLQHLSAILEFFKCRDSVNLIEGFFSTPLPQSIMEEIQESKWQVEIPVVGETIGDYGPFDLVFIDGDHSEQGVYNDLQLVVNHITDDAQILLHDVTDHWQGGVCTGIEKFCLIHPQFELLSIESNIGVLQKTRG